MAKPPNYAAQTHVVRAMMRVLGSLIEASSLTDPDVRIDVAGFPEGTTFVMRVIGSDCEMRLRATGGRLCALPASERLDRPEDVMIAFKHITHAYRVFTFQESTAEAFAYDRLISRGDTGLAMRLTRCINRAQTLAVPLLPLQGTTMGRASRAWNATRLYSKLVAIKTFGA